MYESRWRMSTKSGLFFGDEIWVIIQVERAGTLALTQQMNAFGVGSSQQPMGAVSETVDNFFEPVSREEVEKRNRNPFSPRKSNQNNPNENMDL